MTEKRGRGRPTKYRPEYCQKLVDHMSQGYSYESFPAVVKVSLQTIYDWEKANPDYLEAKKRAFVESRLFWERIGIEGAVGGLEKFNATAWIFTMKNRFHWRDRHETVTEVKVKPYIVERRDGSEVELGVEQKGRVEDEGA